MLLRLTQKGLQFIHFTTTMANMLPAIDAAETSVNIFPKVIFWEEYKPIQNKIHLKSLHPTFSL